jgi:hypothetical protein
VEEQNNLDVEIKNENREEESQITKEKLKEKLNIEKPLTLTEEGKEIKEISNTLGLTDLENEKIILTNIYFTIKNLEEIALDVDKKVYINLDVAKRIDELEKKLENIHELLENSLLVGKSAVIYYLKKNKNRPIKLDILYRKFGKKVVNEVIIELYEKGFVKILR